MVIQDFVREENDFKFHSGFNQLAWQKRDLDHDLSNPVSSFLDRL